MKGGREMNLATIIAGLAVILMLFFAARYIYKEKKKGTTCIGCPYAQTCQKHKAGASCESDMALYQHRASDNQ